MPMQPSPSAETSKPLLPSCRFSRRMCLLLLHTLVLLREEVLGDPDGGHRPRPPGVEGQLGNDLHELSLREAVLLGPGQVTQELLRVSAGDERGDGDEAAVTR